LSIFNAAWFETECGRKMVGRKIGWGIAPDILFSERNQILNEFGRAQCVDSGTVSSDRRT